MSWSRNPSFPNPPSYRELEIEVFNIKSSHRDESVKFNGNYSNTCIFKCFIYSMNAYSCNKSIPAQLWVPHCAEADDPPEQLLPP